MSTRCRVEDFTEIKPTHEFDARLNSRLATSALGRMQVWARSRRSIYLPNAVVG